MRPPESVSEAIGIWVAGLVTTAVALTLAAIFIMVALWLLLTLGVAQ